MGGRDGCSPAPVHLPDPDSVSAQNRGSARLSPRRGRRLRQHCFFNLEFPRQSSAGGHGHADARFRAAVHRTDFTELFHRKAEKCLALFRLRPISGSDGGERAGEKQKPPCPQRRGAGGERPVFRHPGLHQHVGEDAARCPLLLPQRISDTDDRSGHGPARHGGQIHRRRADGLLECAAVHAGACPAGLRMRP